MAKKLEITLVRGTICGTASQVGSVRSLGLKRRMQTVIKTDHPSIRGMIKKAEHLLQVREVEG